MDVSGIAAVATDLSQSRIAEAVQITVLKKAMDIQSQGAMQLIQAATQVMAQNSPNLGTHIDTFA